MVLPAFMLFLLGVILVTFFVLRAKERRVRPRTRLVYCPETGEPQEVQVDRRHELLTLWRDIREVRLKSCSRWPERRNCEQDCLAQIDPTSQVERILVRWYDGKNCARCAMPLAGRDWKMGRAAALDPSGRMVQLRDMDWKQFPNSLMLYDPLCWKCHEAELERRRAARAASAA